MSEHVERNRMIDNIGEEIRRARAAGNIGQAAHFAGMARNILDPTAPIPEAPREPVPERSLQELRLRGHSKDRAMRIVWPPASNRLW